MILSTRAKNVLERAEQRYGTSNILDLTERQVAVLKNCGKMTVEELREFRRDTEEARAEAIESAEKSPRKLALGIGDWFPDSFAIYDPMMPDKITIRWIGRTKPWKDVIEFNQIVPAHKVWTEYGWVAVSE